MKMKMNDRTKLYYYAVVSSLLISQTVLAKETELANKVQACVKISQDIKRLSCFDQLKKKQNSTMLESKIVKLSAIQVDGFSKKHIKKTPEEEAKEIKSITLIISALSKTIRGQWKIMFKNGQKWQQKDTARIKLKQGDIVVLTKGVFTSVYLKKENTSRRIKVKRLK
jgi:hypothetical protein